MFLHPTKRPPATSVEIVRGGDVSVTRAEAQASADARRLATEKVRFVLLVQGARRQLRYTDREAVDFVRTRHACEFSVLVRAGKGGSSAMTYHNYRQWASKIKGVEPDLRVEALLNRYATGCRDRFGSPAFWHTAMALYLNPNRLPLTKAYKMAAAKCLLADPHAMIPSMAQYRYRVRQLDARTVCLARDGEEALKAKYGSYIDRTWDDVAPGEVIVCDSRTFDTRVRVWDATGSRWVARRPTIAGMMDARSWYLVAYWITDAAVSSEILIDTLGLYLHNNHNQPPAIAYCDNGSDYRKQGFSTELEGQSIFKELGIRLVSALPYNARAKTIERCFKDMMQQYDKEFADYLGSRPGERAQAADWYDRHPEDLPTMQQFCAAFDKWLQAMHATPRNGKIHRGKSPSAIWASRPQRPAIPSSRLPFCFLLPIGSRSVARGPAVVIDRIAYYADDLAGYIGQRVIIKLDRLNADHVFCFDAAGRLICEAKPRSAISAMALHDPVARARIAEEMSRQRRELKQVYTMLQTETGGLHLASPAEIFSAQDGDQLVAIGAMASVRGRAHKYIHHRLVPAETLDDVRQDASDVDCVPSQPSSSADDYFADVDISDFDAYITNTQVESDNEF